MAITELNHYFIRANDLEETKNFYCDVLGMQVMPRPDFPFPGYWLGSNGKIVVHMGPAGIPNEDLYYLGTTPKSSKENSGVVDHVAFLCEKPGDFIRRLKDRNIAYRPRSFEKFDLYQIFVNDPNGLCVELNFYGMKNVTDWGGEEMAHMPRVTEVPSKATA